MKTDDKCVVTITQYDDGSYYYEVACGKQRAGGTLSRLNTESAIRRILDCVEFITERARWGR